MVVRQVLRMAFAVVMVAAGGPALSTDINSANSFLGIKIGQPIEQSLELCGRKPGQSDSPCFNQGPVAGAFDINMLPKLGFPYKLSAYHDDAGNVSEISLESSRQNAPFFRLLMELRFGKPTKDARDYSYSLSGEYNATEVNTAGWAGKKIAIWLADPGLFDANKFVVTVLSRQASDGSDTKHAQNMKEIAGQL